MFLYSAFGQEVKVKKKEFRNQPPGFEEAWKAVREGVKKFDEGPASYKAAREYFLKAYTYNDKNAALNYLIGMSYLSVSYTHLVATSFITGMSTVSMTLFDVVFEKIGIGKHSHIFTPGADHLTTESISFR